MTDKPKRRITVASAPELDDFIIEVPMESETLEFPARKMSYSRWMEIERTVPNPPQPINGVTRDGRPNYNPQDAGYIAALQKATQQRDLLHLAEFLQLDWPSDDLTERAAWLGDNLPAGVVAGLLNKMFSLNNEGVRAVAERAATFHEQRPAAVESNADVQPNP
jgi:hypothetical protein